jgi:hypothetical protein
MLVRASAGDLFGAVALPAPAEFVRRQRLVANPILLDALLEGIVLY